MTLIGLALAVLVIGVGGSVLAISQPRWATRLGAGAAVLGSALGLVPALQVLWGRNLPKIDLTWSIPGGALSVGIEPL